MTGDQMAVGERMQIRDLFGADTLRDRTAGAEAAAGWRRDRTWNFTLQHDALTALQPLRQRRRLGR